MLTDDQGNPIPDDDPRLPTAEQTAEVMAEVERLTLDLAGKGVAVSPLLELEAKVTALVSLMVPPEGPLRALFDHRTALRRVETLVATMEQVQAAQRGPALTIASRVPQDLPRGFDVVG